MKAISSIVGVIVVALVGYFAIEWILKSAQQGSAGKGVGLGAAGGGGGSSPLSSLFGGNSLGRTMQQSFQSILQANLPALGLQTTDPNGDSGVFIPSESTQPLDLNQFASPFDLSGGGGGGGNTDQLQTSYDDSSWLVS